MIVFGIHFNFFIVLPIRLKTGTYNGFLFFTRQNVLRDFACPGAQFVQACTISFSGMKHFVNVQINKTNE